MKGSCLVSPCVKLHDYQAVDSVTDIATLSDKSRVSQFLLAIFAGQKLFANATIQNNEIARGCGVHCYCKLLLGFGPCSSSGVVRTNFSRNVSHPLSPCRRNRNLGAQSQKDVRTGARRGRRLRLSSDCCQLGYRLMSGRASCILLFPPKLEMAGLDSFHPRL